MAYTVRQVAKMSGVSVRTLHFYDETGLLKPAYYGRNGYRFYEEPQLLLLQQILFYRELGLELKQIQPLLQRADFEKIAALESHRKVLETGLARNRALLETIDKTIGHLKGTKKMSTEEMFQGFHVASGQARFGERLDLRGEPHHCKLSARDTGGAVCVFEYTGSLNGAGPRHLHREQDEWIYVVEGALDFLVGDSRIRARAGESVFLPRNVTHAWAPVSSGPVRILDMYQPAGKMEDFFRALANFNAGPSVHEALRFDDFKRLFSDHGMELTGPPLVGEWKIEDDGRMVQVT